MRTCTQYFSVFEFSRKCPAELCRKRATTPTQKPRRRDHASSQAAFLISTACFMVLACWGRRHDERDRLGAHMLGVSEGARVPSVSGWRATMVNDVDVLVEELGFVCACRTRRDTHDGHDDGHDDAQLLTNQVRQIRASSPRRAVLRLQEERLRLLTPTEQRGCDDPDDIGCLWSASSLCDISSTSQPDKVSPLSTLISLIPNQY